MKSSLRAIIILLFFSNLPFPLSLGQSQANVKSLSAQAKVEAELEKYVRSLAEGLVPANKFFVMIKAQIAQSTNNQNTNTTGGRTLELPFTSLTVDIDSLKRRIESGQKIESPEDLQFTSLEVEITFDNSVTDAQTQLVENLVRHRLGLTGGNKSISVKKERLIPEPPPPPERQDDPTELELAKVKNERLGVEMERSKFEAARQIADLQRRQEKLEADKLAELEDLKKKHENEFEQLKAQNSVKEEGFFDFLRNVQFILFAIILGVLLFAGIFVFSGAHKKGLSVVSEAIGNVGDAITASSASSDSMVEETPEASAAPVKEAAESSDSGSDPEYIKFITIVEEKIQVLSGEGNLNFFRHFADMAQNNPDYASALIVALGPETARTLTENLSVEHIGVIKEKLESSGGLERAYRLRAQALQDFYGRVAMDEYLGSPIATINDAAWVSRLSNVDLSALLLRLDGEILTGFLSCLTPARLGLIINSIEKPEERAKIMEALKEIEKVDMEKIEEFLSSAKKSFEEMEKEGISKVSRLFDGPRYFAKVMNQLTPDNREELFTAVSEQEDLVLALRSYYIPFKELQKISEGIIAEIFEKRPAAQIAKIIFAADNTLRERILGTLSDRLKDTVNEELEDLDNDSNRHRQNTKDSQKMQDEICKYLLKLNKQGLLEMSENLGESA